MDDDLRINVNKEHEPGEVLLIKHTQDVNMHVKGSTNINRPQDKSQKKKKRKKKKTEHEHENASEHKNGPKNGPENGSENGSENGPKNRPKNRPNNRPKNGPKNESQNEHEKRLNYSISFDYTKYYERVNKWKEKRRAYTKTGNNAEKINGIIKACKEKECEHEKKKNTKRKYDISGCQSNHQRKNNKTENNVNRINKFKKENSTFFKLESDTRNCNQSDNSGSSSRISRNCTKCHKICKWQKNPDKVEEDDKKRALFCGCNINYKELDTNLGRNINVKKLTNECRNEKNKQEEYHNCKCVMVKNNEESFSSSFHHSEEDIDSKQDEKDKLTNMHDNAKSNETVIQSEEQIIYSHDQQLVYSNETIIDQLDNAVNLNLQISNLRNVNLDQLERNSCNGKHMNCGKNQTILIKSNKPNLNTPNHCLAKLNSSNILRTQMKEIFHPNYSKTEQEKGTKKRTPKTSIYNERSQLLKNNILENIGEMDDITSSNLKKNNKFYSKIEGNCSFHSKGYHNGLANYCHPSDLSKDSFCNHFCIGFHKHHYNWPCNSSVLNIKNPFAYIYKSAKFFGNAEEECRKEKNEKKLLRTISGLCVNEMKKTNIYEHERNITEDTTSTLTVKKNDLLFSFEGNHFNSLDNFSLLKNREIGEKESERKYNTGLEKYTRRREEIDDNFENQFRVKLPNEMRLNMLSDFSKWCDAHETLRCDIPQNDDIQDRSLHPTKNGIIQKKKTLAEDGEMNTLNMCRRVEFEKEVKSLNYHKKLIDIGEKDIENNFDLFLSLFMKYEQREPYLFCLLCDEELTKNSFFFQNCIKPIFDDYRKSKFEKLKKEKYKNNFPCTNMNDIHINKIIIEIMTPSIKKKYLKYVSELYDKKEYMFNDISDSHELQKEVFEINNKIENLNIKSLDKHRNELSIKSNSHYEKKIKLIEKPKWSDEKNLKKLLQKQQNYNPFTIFGTSIKEVNLEEVFTLDVYNNYVTNEDRFRNKILYDLYVGKYIQNLYNKIDNREWNLVLDSLKKHWKYFTNLECNMFLDPLLLEEILWYIDDNKMYKDKSEIMYTYENCFCPTPDPGKEINLNDEKHFAKSMGERYTSHHSIKHKNLSLNEENVYPHNTLILKYDDISVEKNALTCTLRDKEMLTKEDLLFNIPRPSSAFYYDSDFFENKIKKNMFRKKVKRRKDTIDEDVVTSNVEPYVIKYKSKKWTSQKFFDNFFSNYYLYNFGRSNRMYNSII
ncbi:hypothetical protein, conserved [Plasmodium gonderi]|uniref:Inner centromere protein ARK-binding domain-containing protein n=1 Tax=Plasmodium gonderi TaxID=77519 RepID=A0A1Y1JLQ8_PLAGO|nr:hypothetical protein, conserved [Plasmodium gonderi]GAW82167.1 hypothetical protein, conserved [Plasmodium gonderi]